MRVPKIMGFFPNPKDATSFYRGVGPLGTMAREGKIELTVNEPMNWVTLRQAHIFFHQRPFMMEHLAYIQEAKAAGKPVWIDYDDNMFTVPTCGNRHSIYWDPGTQDTVAKILALADAVTVSTQALADFYCKLPFVDPKKIVVINNAFDPETMTLEREPVRADLVIWRGSIGHQRDLYTHTEALCSAIAGAGPNWSFEFWGEPFWHTLEKILGTPGVRRESILTPDALDTSKYMRVLRQKRPRIVIVPLEDTSFNRAKSNIAWLEATHAGAVCIAPDWPEWDKPGVIRYKNADDFRSCLDDVLAENRNEPDLWADSRDCIANNYMLADKNAIRERVISSLLER